MDTAVECARHSWKAHRAVLAAASPVFHRMLSSDCVEGTTGNITISGADPAAVEELLKFIYTGSVPSFDSDRCVDPVALLALALAYDVVDLTKPCCVQVLSHRLVDATNVVHLIRLLRGHVDMAGELRDLQALI